MKSVLWKPTPWNGIPFFIDACNHLRVACSAASKADFFPSSFLVAFSASVAASAATLVFTRRIPPASELETQAALAFVFWPGNDFSPLDRRKMSSFQCLHPQLSSSAGFSSFSAKRPSQIETSMILQSLQPAEKPAFYYLTFFILFNKEIKPTFFLYFLVSWY